MNISKFSIDEREKGWVRVMRSLMRGTKKNKVMSTRRCRYWRGRGNNAECNYGYESEDRGWLRAVAHLTKRNLRRWRDSSGDFDAAKHG